MAFRVSARAAAGANKFVQLADPHVENWWRAYRPTYGQIVRTRSNFMQDPIGPLFEGVGTKVQHKFWDNIFDVVPPFVALIVTMKMSEEAWREHGKEHWG